MSSDINEIIINAALPDFALFSKENFAGDKEVKQFYELLKSNYEQELEIYVSWACPPDVTILKSKYGNFLIRSERLDTLLVEFLHLRWFYHNDELDKDSLLKSSIYRWMGELLIGYRAPTMAMAAFQNSFKATDRLKIHGFRDESLASIPLPHRISLQCTCLAHEIGHIIYPKKENCTLNSTVDGLSLLTHLERDLNETGLSDKQIHAIKEVSFTQIDANALIFEIEADLFAYEKVVVFLLNCFELSIKEAIEISFLAFEAQSFINSCKSSCRILKKSSVENLDSSDYQNYTFLHTCQTSVRARCVVRRAGILWANIEAHGKKLSISDYNKYVALIDEINIPLQPFLYSLERHLVKYSDKLFHEFRNYSIEEIESTLNEQLTEIGNDKDKSLELYYLLIAFGLPGGTRPLEYIKSLL